MVFTYYIFLKRLVMKQWAREIVFMFILLNFVTIIFMSQNNCTHNLFCLALFIELYNLKCLWLSIIAFVESNSIFLIQRFVEWIIFKKYFPMCFIISKCLTYSTSNIYIALVKVSRIGVKLYTVKCRYLKITIQVMINS